MYSTAYGYGYYLTNKATQQTVNATAERIKLKDNLYLISLRASVGATSGINAYGFSVPSSHTVISTLSILGAGDGDSNGYLTYANYYNNFYFNTVGSVLIASCFLLATIS